MKKLIAILAALLLTFALAAAEEENITMLDGPSEIHRVQNFRLEPDPVTISFKANITTGYSWVGFVTGGHTVELSGMEGTYVSDANPMELDGVGGRTYFTLIPVKPGASIVTFTYRRPWDPENGSQTVVLAVVDEEMNLFVSDITESGVIAGKVVSVDAAAHSALLNTETHGKISACFPADAALPAAGEQIVIYTDGTMTMSLPAIMNVIAWETVPAEQARINE